MRPLALRLGVEIELVEPDDYARVWGLVDRGAGTALVCWRHDFLPSLARASGVDQVPLAWPANRYDIFWLFA